MTRYFAIKTKSFTLRETGETMKKIQDILYKDDDMEKLLDVYLPDGETSAVFVYLHGGGILEGDKGCAEVFAPYLTSHGVALVSANYRMYPDAKYPDFIHDAADAVAWTNRYMRSTLECDKLYVGGSSAGGYISMMLCFDKQYLEGAGLDNSAIAGYFFDAGQPTAHFTVLKYRGIDPRRIIVDETAPIYHVGLLESYPPMHFIVSDDDIVNRYEQTMLMMRTLAHFGHTNYTHTVMHGTHCAYCGKTDENGDGVLGKLIYSFIESK